MNYLELCQRVRQECGINGNGPSAIDGQTGVYQKIINWVNDAWREIQIDKQQWRFRWKPFNFETIATIADYTTVSLDVRDFTREPAALYLQSKGVQDRGFIPYIDYKEWYERYGAKNIPDDRPTNWTVLPNGSIRLTPAPDDIYIFSGNGQLKIQNLTKSTDIPIMPADYHMAIVWLAAAKWFEDQEAFERMQTVRINYQNIKDELLRDQLPQMSWGFGAL